MSAFNTAEMRGNQPRCASKSGVGGEGVYSAQEVAGMFGVSVSTVWRWVAAGILRKPIKIGGTSRWTGDDMRDMVIKAKAARETG